MAASIDLNADLGESFGAYTIGNDKEVLQLISSANIASGFHAGDPSVMYATCTEAIAVGVRIGAHPGYRDLAGFGRRAMHYHPSELKAEIIYQIGALQAIAHSAGGQLSYVKPHGALYNYIARPEGKDQAAAVIEAILSIDPKLKLMGLAGSSLLDFAKEEGLEVIAEAFADRAYHSDGSLVARSQPGAVLHDPQQASAQAVAFALQQPLTTIEGDEIDIHADSICVHGDNAAALALIQTIRTQLAENGVDVSAC